MPRISYDITTTGGVEVARGFQQIANAAKASQAQLEQQNRKTTAGLAATSAAVRDLRASAEASLSQLGPLGSALSALGRTGPAGLAIAGLSAVTVGLGAAALKAIDMADQLQDAAEVAGISVERFQSLRFALAGIGVDEPKLSGFLNKFEANLGGVYNGTGTLTKALKTIDPALLEAIKHAPTVERAFDLIVEKLESMPNSAQKARLAVDAFGKGSGALAAAAHTGADGLTALEEEAKAVGAVVDRDLLIAASKASDKLAQMGIVIRTNLMASFIEVAPEIEAVTQKIITLTGAVARFISGRRAGEKSITPEIAGLTSDIALLENFLETLKGGGPALEEERAKTLDDILALNKKRDALLEVAAAKKKADEAAAAPTAPGPDEAAGKKAQSDRERADAILADARRSAAMAGLEGEAKAREQAKQDIEEKSAELKKLITDEKEAADAIAKYKVERTAEMEKELTKIHDEEGKKQAAADEAKRKQQEAADRRLQGATRAVRRATTGVGGDTEASIWQEAADAYEEYQHDVEEGIEDEQRRLQLLSDFWIATEEKTQARLAELRDKNAEKAAAAAEKAAKEGAAAQEKFLAPVEHALERIGDTLSDALVNAFGDGEDAAKSFEEVALDVIKSIVAEIAQMAIRNLVIEPLMKQLTSSGLLGGAGAVAATPKPPPGPPGPSPFGLLGGSAPAIGVGPVLGPAPEGQNVADLEKAAGSASTSLLGMATAAVTVGAALFSASQAIAQGRDTISEASRGTGGEGGFTTVAGANVAAFTAGFAAAGAAIGAAGFGVGAVVGGAVGAAVGAAVATALNKSLASGIASGIDKGVAEGLDQAGLDAAVQAKLSKDPIVSVLFPVAGQSTISTILSGGLNKIFGDALIAAFTPSIERIFEKILRQALGGVGGISTAGIPVDPRGYSGLRPLAGTAGQASRIIAEGFGAGGEAFSEERRARFTKLILAATKKESERTGEEAGTTLAQVFMTAFQGSFMQALRAAFKVGGGQPARSFKFVAEQFTKGGGGLDYQTVADVVLKQKRAPGDQAVKASTEAVSGAVQAAFTDAANSQAFRRSLAASVAEAFGEKAGQVLAKSLGDIFSPFFALSKDARKEFRRERRQGDFPGALEVLTDDFLSRVKDFAKVAADPQIAANLALLADAMLQLQVATAVASGDIVGAADAIEGALGATIQLVRDIQQLQRDVESRTRLALAGPGIAGDREAIAEARRRREEAEGKLGGFGKIGFFAGTGTPFGATVEGGTTKVTPLEPAEILGPLKEFAEARLEELEQEIALARQLQDTFEALAQQFHALHQSVEATLGRADPTADIADKVAKVAEAQAALGSLDIDEVDPEKFTDLATAVSDAIAAATARFQELTQAIATFEQIARGITETLGGMAGQKARLDELQASATKLLPTVVAGGEGSQKATADLAATVQEAVGIATSRRQFFAGAQEGFEGLRDQAAIAARGDRARRQQLSSKRAELAAITAKALSGDADALARAQALSSEILTLAGSGARGRRIARDIESRSALFAKAAEAQKTIAEDSLASLKIIADTTTEALKNQKDAVEKQLEYLGGIAKQAEIASLLLFVGFGFKVEAVRQEIEDFRTDMKPILEGLEAAAKTTLHDDLVEIQRLLGTEGEMGKVWRLLDARLPAGVVSNEKNLAVTNKAPAPEPVTTATINLTVNVPQGTSPSQARELGRSTAAGVDEAVTSVQRRRNIRRVA